MRCTLDCQTAPPRSVGSGLISIRSSALVTTKRKSLINILNNMRKSFLFAWALLLALGAGVIWYFPRAREVVSTVPESEERTERYFESIRPQPGELLAFLRKMPKGGDLHTHLSGAVYAETFISWAQQAK